MHVGKTVNSPEIDLWTHLLPPSEVAYRHILRYLLQHVGTSISELQILTLKFVTSSRSLAFSDWQDLVTSASLTTLKRAFAERAVQLTGLYVSGGASVTNMIIFVAHWLEV
jgi:hypothetical protein